MAGIAVTREVDERLDDLCAERTRIVTAALVRLRSELSYAKAMSAQ